MRKGRAIGLDEIPVDSWKSSREAGLEWLTRLFNIILGQRSYLKLGDRAQ